MTSLRRQRPSHAPNIEKKLRVGDAQLNTRGTQDLADNLEKFENGGEPKKVPEITESQVSSIRTQIDKLNPDDATKKEEKEFIATRRKITEDDDEDTFDEDGNQLYNLYIARREPRVEPSGGEEENADSET
jgi:hypothetical protein